MQAGQQRVGAMVPARYCCACRIDQL